MVNSTTTLRTRPRSLITNLRVYLHNHLPLKYQNHKDPALQFYPPPLVTNYNGVYKLLSKLNIHKAMVPDQIPNIFLKKTAIHTAELLTCIFNQSISTHSLPKDWLQANINPLFKKGNTNLAVNDRPVSLTCVLQVMVDLHMLILNTLYILT